MKSLPDEMPSPKVKLGLLSQAIDAFTGAGYRQIGMDHFALPEDELAIAVDRRDLHRNFMGYTVQKTRDMVALGVSGIGEVQGAFIQNTKKLSTYYEAISLGRFPVERGYELQPDDLLRREVIASLMCNFRVDIRRIESRFSVSFKEYFAAEIRELTAQASVSTDGLVTLTDTELAVTPLGQLFVRNVCMVFDRYLRARLEGPAPVFSRTV
jgi:oxygen-independent coproporphyrinogen-3 oxidase